MNMFFFSLTGTKIVEAPFLSVCPAFRRLGLGSRLLTSLKQCGQIGPYDAIRVRIDSSRSDLRRFYLSNQFSDDLILNASFDQLHSVYSDGDEDDDDDDETCEDCGDDDEEENDDNGIRNRANENEDDDDESEDIVGKNTSNSVIVYSDTKTNKNSLNFSSHKKESARELCDSFTVPRDCSLRAKSNIAHSASFGSFQRPLFNQHHHHHISSSHHHRARHHHHQSSFLQTRRCKAARNRPSGRGRNTGACKLISLCYLPPFAASTGAIIKSLPNGASVANTNGNANGMNVSSIVNLTKLNNDLTLNSMSDSIDDFNLESQAMLDEIENRQVDAMIEDAHRLWRRELLSAYRTQWSCVARLRAEIVRLREKVQECEETIGSLKKDNHHLRTSLLQSKFFFNFFCTLNNSYIFIFKNRRK